MVSSINKLGLFYIKMAQSISNLSFLLKGEVVTPLKVFQDAVTRMPPEEVIATVIEEFGQHPNALFVDFDAAKPFKVASMGNTYIVTPRGETRPIFFKVQRRNLSESLQQNRRLNALLLKTIAVFTPQPLAPVLDFVAAQVTGMEDAIEKETDFRIEARNLRRFRRLFMFQSGVRIPKPYRKWTTKHCIGMELLPGKNIDKELDIRFVRDDNTIAGGPVCRFEPGKSCGRCESIHTRGCHS